ncbi:MAG: hypothetical protein EZS28_007549 [Streblomastix strix]|uniref:Uncharacterized protein n=1 Tax=Streblomastix strix TaxID=222440 RepID=A0A5J4WPN2_9EUKA|nr:MAG: hypothetical protein EZS28_007549 [Streblomastix strix]
MSKSDEIHEVVADFTGQEGDLSYKPDSLGEYKIDQHFKSSESDSTSQSLKLDSNNIQKPHLQSEIPTSTQIANMQETLNVDDKSSQVQNKIETSQSELTRLTTEVQHLTTELSQLKPITTSPKQQSKHDLKHQQIQQSVPPCLNPNIPQGIIPDDKYDYQEGSKIIHSDKKGCSTVAFDTVISNGIVRFGGFFEHPSYSPLIIIGIADSSTVFGSNEWPDDGKNEKKTVCYSNFGRISHIGYGIPGNSPIELNKTVSCEIFLRVNNSSFTITEFENVQYSSAKGGIKGQRIVEWGKEWKR